MKFLFAFFIACWLLNEVETNPVTFTMTELQEMRSMNLNQVLEFARSRAFKLKDIDSSYFHKKILRFSKMSPPEGEGTDAVKRNLSVIEVKEHPKLHIMYTTTSLVEYEGMESWLESNGFKKSPGYVQITGLEEVERYEKGKESLLIWKESRRREGGGFVRAFCYSSDGYDHAKPTPML